MYYIIMKPGSIAEDTASCYLRKNGYRVVARNRRFGGIEIDILAIKYLNNIKNVYFIEVKEMKTKHYLSGYPPVSRKQWLRYERSVRILYLQAKKFINTHISLIILDENHKIIQFITEYRV